VKAIFQSLSQQNPNPTTELIYRSPFELLVAVMLSAQATDKGVNKATHSLFQVANTPQTILDLGEIKLKQYLQSINYYPTKARHILQTCALLIARHEGQVPNNRVDLEALPGVGRKTANVMLNVAFGYFEVAVDTHIFRVCNRTGLAVGSTPRAVEQVLRRCIPTPYQRHAHHWLVLHGRYTCKARRPLCETCLIQKFCDKNL
jgi:endonuclease III